MYDDDDECVLSQKNQQQQKKRQETTRRPFVFVVPISLLPDASSLHDDARDCSCK